jgi:alkylated DNA repair dioxygenase AlkB
VIEEHRPLAAGARCLLGHGAFIDHLTGWLPGDQASTAFAALRTELAWEARAIVLFGRRILQPRLVAWAGALPYRYSGQTLPPRPFTPTVQALVERVVELVGVPFNHVLANRYRDGQDSMGLHADAEAELGPDPVVATLSFGATRGLQVVPRKGDAGERRVFALGHGDLLVMGGTCQTHFRHGIPRASDVGERISLTLRQVLRAPAT